MQPPEPPQARRTASPPFPAQVNNKRNEFLVIHRTGGNSIGSAINTFTNSNNITGIHYLVDVDGHVLKLVHEDDRCNHAGAAFWQRVTTINARSIGIEIVHGGNDPFPDAQYESVLRLVREIRAAYPDITRHRVVGHSDIAVRSANDRTLSDRRINDPGETFDWARLENAGLVRRRVAGPPPQTLYGIGPGEFVSRAEPDLPNGQRPDYAAIQRDLSSIGYSIARNGTTVSGDFDEALEQAIRAFQRRYFSGANSALRGPEFRDGQRPRIDYSTAFALQMVVADTLP